MSSRPDWEIPATVTAAISAVRAIRTLSLTDPAQLAAVLAGLNDPAGPSLIGELTDVLYHVAAAVRDLPNAGADTVGWIEDAADRISAVADDCLGKARADLEQTGGSR
jgi:hypothetical protein